MAIKTKHIRAWMVKRGLTQGRIGQEAGVSQQFVSMFLNGRRVSAGLRQYFVGRGCPERYFGMDAKNGEGANGQTCS